MFLKEWHKILLLLLLCFLVAGVFYGSLFSGFSSESPPLSRDSFLELTISGPVAERSIDDPFAETLGSAQPLSLQDMLQALRKAKMDDRIKGVLLRPAALSMGWGKVQELRNALLDFKESEKPIYAYVEAVANKDYYLASVADTIAGIRTGFMFVNGFLSQPSFLKETLSKVGVEADFVAHGKYKNAPDGYTRESMSDAQREVTNAILDEFYGTFVSTLSESRNISESKVKSLVDKGFFSVEEALKQGLVDTAMYYEEVKGLLKSTHGKRLKFTSLGRYKRVPYSSFDVTPDNEIAVIYGVGTIVIGGVKQYADGLITSEGMAKSIREAADDDDIKAIVLRIDSPGGSGTASDVIWREVVEAKKKKPVVASVSDLAASGGYYIAMAADSIIAEPGSIVGSIGVFAGKFSMKQTYEKIGMNIETLRRGRNADIFSSTSKFSPEQRQIIRGFVMEFYQDFISKVAEGRDMSIEDVDAIAQGRVWTGRQGLEIGLVDKLGDFSDAVDTAKRLAELPVDEPVLLKSYPELESSWERLLSSGISVDATKILPELTQLPPVFRNTLKALPHFKAGEPLFLSEYVLDGMAE
ncbi:MAG: signal peptide peptidase SppA [Calditrichia bacterium]